MSGKALECQLVQIHADQIGYLHELDLTNRTSDHVCISDIYMVLMEKTKNKALEKKIKTQQENPQCALYVN